MINLLPEEEQIIVKKELEIKARSLFLFCFLIFLIAILLVVTIFNLYWLGERENLEIKLAGFSKEIEQIENSFLMKEKEKIEKNLDVFEKNLENQNYFYSSLLKPLAELTPDQVYFKSITVSYPTVLSKKKKKTKKQERKLKVTLTGYAPNRIILLEFKENLEKADWVTNFYFPPSNWIEEKDINFYLTFDLK
jgi:Tfp pilus assembly protein PilN